MSACLKLKNIPIEQAEVIIPAYACPDPVSAALYAGAKPVLIDLEINSPFPSCEQVLAKIRPCTIAIVAINFMGLQGNALQLKQICKSKGLAFIYDCAQWFPAENGYIWPGDFNIISFGRGKPVSLLHGGAVIFDDREAENALPELPLVKGNWIYNLIQAIKVRVYNFMAQPIIYRFASQLPGLNVGQTLYKPLPTIKTMSPYYAELIKSNTDKFRARNNALLSLHQAMQSISHLH